VNVLIVHSHPEPRSFCSALMRAARDELAALGHAVTVTDLYAEGFDPVLSAADFTDRLDPAFLRPMEEQEHAVAGGTLREDVAHQVGRLRALLVMTSSYSDGAFRAEGSIGDIATVLRPVTYGTLAYCGMQVLEPFIAYGADEVGDDTRAGYLAALRARLGEL
jgi:NAD(P)H dehydrogenase (quinone)